jgi:hypothetical protein
LTDGSINYELSYFIFQQIGSKRLKKMKIFQRILAIAAASACLLVVPLLAESYHAPFNGAMVKDFRNAFDGSANMDLHYAQQLNMSGSRDHERSRFWHNLRAELSETITLQYRALLWEAKRMSISSS